MNEVRRKRELEEEQRLRAERKKQQLNEKKEKERTERLRKREIDRKRMKEDLKKRMAKPAKSGLEFEFVGVTYGEDGEQDKELEESKDDSFSQQDYADKGKYKFKAHSWCCNLLTNFAYLNDTSYTYYILSF